MKNLTESTNPIPRSYLFRVSSIHTAVGISIVSVSGFVNSEMKFLGWEPSNISIYFGIAVLFELSRLWVGYLQDQNPRTEFYLIIGSILSIIGLALIPILITSVNDPIFIVGLAVYYFGTAITTTIVDSYLTTISQPKERNRISGTLQFARLLGFAFGGVLGSLIYAKLDFVYFIMIITTIFTLFAIITIKSLDLKARAIHDRLTDLATETFESNQSPKPTNRISIIRSLRNQDVLLMSLFLILFSIGLFMQDLILEPYAISDLNFQKSDVGKLVAIWGIITLIFVPIGSTLEPKLGKLKTISIGLIIAFFGMILITFSSNYHNTALFIIGLVIFSAGGGISSGPAISVMLELCFLNTQNTAFLLGFFGVIVTIGRSTAAIISGILLNYSNDNFAFVFFVEAIFLMIALVPIVPMSRRIDRLLEKVKYDNKMLHTIPSLD